MVSANAMDVSGNAAGQMRQTGIGLDSTSVDSSYRRNFVHFIDARGTTTAEYEDYLLGYHYLQHLERGTDATITWFGDASWVYDLQTGMIGHIQG